MATTRTFNAMLNDHLNPDIMREEMVKRDYVFSKVEQDNDWKGADYVVPFQGAGASSLSFGALTASTDVSESQYVRGVITSRKEVWGTMSFNQLDLMEHSGQIPEKTFLKILPNEIDRFMDLMKETVSVALTSGPHFATATEDGGADGTIKVDKIDRFQIGQKVILDDSNSSVQACYVIGIDLDNKDLTVSATRGGSALDISGYTLAQAAKFYHPGATTAADTFTSLRQAFLSAANGGESSLHGQTKTAYPILQAYNHSGASINSSNVLDSIFDAYTQHRVRARGNVSDVLVSYKHLGSIFKSLEVQKGGYRVTKDAKANVYGWTEISIGSVKGDLNIVGIQEMDDDVIFGVDWKSLKFATNGLFRKRTSPSGNQYFEVRATTGYSYLVDICLFGEMAYLKPSNNFVIHSIPAYA